MYKAIHQIPILDFSDHLFSDLNNLNIDEYKQLEIDPVLLKAVEKGLENGDFFQVFGTEIPIKLPSARQASLDLFSHSSQVLEEAHGHPELFRQRGYSPFGGEKAVGAEEVDLHRQFWMSGHLAESHLGAVEDRQYDVADQDPNTLSPNFGSSVRSILHEAIHVARILLRCFETLYQFEAGELIAKTMGADTVIRTLYYQSPALNTILAGEHDDINLITVLAGDMWGLEVLINDEFYPVLIRPDCVLVNLGEMLNQIHGCEHLGRIRHRVVARPGIHNPRIQFATFVHLLRDTRLLNDVRCGDWFAQRIQEITTK